jgi:sortase A
MDAVGSRREARWFSARRLRRLLTNTLIFVGVALLVWTFVVWRWNDPVTSLYTRYEQHKLVAVHEQIVRSYRPKRVIQTSSPAAEAAAISSYARKLRAGAAPGAPIGKIVVPRLGLSMLLVNGTDHDSLRRGPGRDERSFMPGQGELIYIAGHRTTYLAPFANIDKLKVGDPVTLEMPYGTFVYKITGHEIVDAHDLTVLQSHHREVLALQACHPRFFATQRYIAWARPVKVILPGGKSYTPR